MDDLEQDHPGVQCQDENCHVAIHTRHPEVDAQGGDGTELLDHVLEQIAQNYGQRPVTCGGRQPHELYLSDGDWAQMRVGLEREVANLTRAVRDQGGDPDVPGPALERRREQLAQWEAIEHRWRLSTLVAYYRHLRGTEEDYAGAARPYVFCGTDGCRALITPERVAENGHYHCGVCQQDHRYACNQNHIGMTCQEFADQGDGGAMYRILHDPRSDVRPCPHCLAPTQRNLGCDHIHCQARVEENGRVRVCNRHWNWVFGGRPNTDGYEAVPSSWSDGEIPRQYRVRGDAETEHTDFHRRYWENTGNVGQIFDEIREQEAQRPPAVQAQ